MVIITLVRKPARIVKGLRNRSRAYKVVNQRSKIRRGHTRLFETGAIVSPHCSAAITRDCRQSCRGHNKTYGIGEPRGVAASRRDASRRPRAVERRNLSMGVEKKVRDEKVQKDGEIGEKGIKLFFSKIKD